MLDANPAATGSPEANDITTGTVLDIAFNALIDTSEVAMIASELPPSNVRASSGI